MSSPAVSFELSAQPPQPRPLPAVSPFHLTPQQVQFFDDSGYLVLRQWVTGELLLRLQGAASRWITDGNAFSAAGGRSEDYNLARRQGGEALFRINYLHNKGEAASLALLGSPAVLGVAESLCGPNFVPTYESLVFKAEGDGEQIPWHQDAVHPRQHRIFNFDLYLDASRIGAGALRVVPGTQRRLLDPCEIRGEYGWDAPGVLQVEMEPGDVLLHDVMVLHGSEPTVGNALRRTIYLEFRAAEQIVAEGPWDRQWIDRRLRLLPLALEARKALNLGAEFAWNVAPEYRLLPLGDGQAELKVVHEVHTPGAWCSAGSVK
ncbi:phytanoyl-CoA dioxygenase family protein [Deinococcus alpinitundrae]|uniref:phytanoyl-CoA dioxygenase family protein n=1 Tax=Deinococcus alpinitundrae TaxID=468913 RepID=UPI00137968AF|nr:phytanoyl-CoA dioxygenase family protein [Deinococcus alpinitundrae]